LYAAPQLQLKGDEIKSQLVLVKSTEEQSTATTSTSYAIWQWNEKGKRVENSLTAQKLYIQQNSIAMH
jgi:hypothetical protein